MKVLLGCLVLLALLLPPAFAEKQAIPNQAPPVNHGSEASIAETAPQEFQPEKVEEPAPSYSMFRAVGGLGLVTFLMIAAYFAVRRFGPRFFAKGAPGPNLKVIETLSVGDKRSISMIQLGNSRFLIGNTAQQISLLMTLPDSVSLVSESDTLPEIPKVPSKKDFTIPFKRLLEVEKSRPAQGAAHPLPEDIRTKMRQLREALER